MRALGWAVLSVVLAGGCASDQGGSHATAAHVEAAAAASPWTGVTEAVAVVHATRGNRVSGVVRFTDVTGGVRVVADFEGLAPGGTHAFHVHEFGDCSSGDGKSAGAHYNPEGHPHAGPDTEMRHAGDLGNVVADPGGKAHLDRVFAGLSVAGAHNPVVGRSVIIHVAADDFTTQPTGNAGDRMGCGVIGVAKPSSR